MPGDETAPPAPPCPVGYQVGGLKVFGHGMYELLRGLDATGSLFDAASRMGVPYETAWRAVRRCEKLLRTRLVTRRAGGVIPGARLTPRGRTILGRYEALAVEHARVFAAMHRRPRGGDDI